MNTEQTSKELVAKAKAKDLYHVEVDISLGIECEFLSCEENSVLYMEGFHVCIVHGSRLIQCLTERLGDDTVDENDTNDTNE